LANIIVIHMAVIIRVERPSCQARGQALWNAGSRFFCLSTLAPHACHPRTKIRGSYDRMLDPRVKREDDNQYLPEDDK